MSRFRRTAKAYLRNFETVVKQARASGATSIEMATRPVVHGFIEQLVKLTEPEDALCVIHHDTRAAVHSRPDWRFEDKDTFGVYAYGDHKDLKDVANYRFGSGEKSQLRRYLDFGRPVFVFDGIEFIFLDPKVDDPFDAPDRVFLVPKSDLAGGKPWAELEIDGTVETRFKDLLGQPGFHKWSESELVEQLAKRARLISEVVSELLGSPQGSGRDGPENLLISALHGLHEQLRSHHDPSLTDVDTCADFVAQALVFGVFYAHTQAPDHGVTPDERRNVITAFWTDASYMAAARRLRPFHTIADVLSEALGHENDLRMWHEDAVALLAHAEYLGTKRGPADFHALFERFLTAFKPEMRFDYGAFYTPKVLSDWIIRFSDALCRRCFSVSLANAVDKVVDPCMGTGGLLEAFIINTACEYGDRTELVGFEILPAPYALAQYRLSEVAKGTRFESNLNLFLTDTLADQILTPPARTKNRFAQEIREASSWVRTPVRLVVGNPPSTGAASSHAPRNVIESMLEDFRPPAEERSTRQNTQKAVNNEAYKFLRWSAAKVLAAERGILALVLPGSFVRAISLKYARTWLQEKFDQIWILELDEDGRTGAGTESLFKVLQGRAAIFAVCGTTEEGRYFHSIASAVISEKISFLEAQAAPELFQEVTGEVGQLAPQASYPDAMWKSAWPLTSTTDCQGIFQAKCSGIKLSPSGVLFHTDRNIMRRRCAVIGKKPLHSWDAIAKAWFKGQRRPPTEKKMTDAVRIEVAAAAKKNRFASFVDYSYRPFVSGIALMDDNLFQALGKAPGAGTRVRPEVKAAFGSGAVAICVAPSPRDLGSSLTRFASFAWHLPDNDNVARGNAMVYCDRFPKIGGKKGGKLKAISNVTPELHSLFSFASDPPRAAVCYVYAVLCSPSFLEAFEPVLYVSSDPKNPCRIPIAKEVDVREKIVAFGEEIAELESDRGDTEVSLQLVGKWASEKQSFKLNGHDAVVEDGVLKLKDENGKVALTISGISARCLTEQISGHPVIAKWLRERTYAYLRREFLDDDLRQFLKLVSRIEEQHRVIDRVDILVCSLIKAGTGAVVPPTKLVADVAQDSAASTAR